MPFNWSDISPLSPPLKTTGEDVILSGHGSFEFNGETQVPAGVELWVLAPPGGSISDDLGGALESMEVIHKLGVVSPTTHSLSPIPPTRYVAGKSAPNYTLHPPRGIVVKPGGPHIIGSEKDTNLADLWARVQPFVKAGKTTRVFWAACSALSGAKNKVVIHN
jgi:hypothetical protein